MIATILLTALLATKSVVHSGIALSKDQSNPASIEVRACNGVLAPIYADPKLVVPLRNPFFADRFGGYEFYSIGPEEISITVSPDLPPVVLSTCPKEKK